jgi:uncharacterized membrane protein
LHILEAFNLCAAVIFVPFPWDAFWPYFAGIVILTAGLLTCGRDIVRDRGIDKIVTLGPVFFAVPMAVFASQHFTQAKAVATLVPHWLPGKLFWTYFIGAAVIAASLGIVLRKQSRLAAGLLGILLILFVLLLHIRNIVSDPRNVIPWAIALRDLSFGAGAIALAGTETGDRRSGAARTLIVLARIFVATATIYYGVVHFVHPEFMPGIDFDRSVPAWIPLRFVWSYLAGAAFLITGVALLFNKTARQAAIWLGMTVLVLIVLVYLPIVVSKPLDVDEGLNFFVSMLAFSGVALVVARAIQGQVVDVSFYRLRPLDRDASGQRR